MKKKFLLFIISLLPLISSAEVGTPYTQGYSNTPVCYRLASYSQNSQTQGTPLFDLQIFNKPCFEIYFYNGYAEGFQFFFNLIVGLSIAMTIIMFTYGAATAILKEVSPQSKAGGKETMQNALIGLVIVLSTWLVINTVNPDLVRLPYFQNAEQLAKYKNPGGNAPTGIQGSPGQ